MGAQWKSVDALTFARAFGISLMLFNHAWLGVKLGGGLNVLLILSGVSFATLGLSGTSRDSLRSMVGFLSRLLIVAWALMFVAFARDGKVDFLELALISHWFSKEFTSPFPVWYVQTIFQTFLLLGVLFALFNLTPKIQARPILACMLLWLGAVALAGGSKLVWDSQPLGDWVFHLHVWNFLLGWLYWALFIANTPTLTHRLFFIIAGLLAGVVLMGVLGINSVAHGTRLYVFSGAVVFLGLVDKLVLPRMLAHLIFLISQSTLYIFFLHWSWFKLSRLILSLFDDPPGLVVAVTNFTVALVGCIALWALVTATSRSWVKRRTARPA